MTGPTAADWHDVECGSYTVDLPLWRELATAAGGPVLDIGAGTGRVALDLARKGHTVTAIDSDADLVRALTARARAEGLPVTAHTADARSPIAGGPFALVLLVMQVVQLLGGPEGRSAMLGAVLGALGPAGVLAIALADPFEAVPAGESLPPLPDILERDGWVFSSLPVTVRDQGDSVAIDRVRQAVSPDGELTDEFATITLDSVSPATLEHEALTAGYALAGRREIPATHDHIGSTVVMLTAP
jgi:SAM-dependent methyltransferase